MRYMAMSLVPTLQQQSSMVAYNTMSENSPRVSTDLLEVRHTTTYRYRQPVSFGQHKAMFRPHDSHDLRLLGLTIDTQPQAHTHWQHDVFSNSITMFDFSEPSDQLTIRCVFQVIRSSVDQPSFPIDSTAKFFPFQYSSEQLPDLAPSIRPEYDHEDGHVKKWAHDIVNAAGGETWSILKLMNERIHAQFQYNRREEPGVQKPRKTLESKSGSCRDFAVLMLEAARHLGFAARFVTGYLYDPLSDQDGTIRGAGATHAWVQIFVPGAGWVEFDPTNGLISAGNLIRTGVSRTPEQAMPLKGSFNGPANSFAGMDVSVEVKALAPTLT